MEQKTKLALLAHNKTLLNPLSTMLESLDFEVERYTDSAILLEDVVEFLPDIVLHIDAAEQSSLELIGSIRLVSTVPLVIITPKTDEMDEVLMLKLGADMVMTLPYSQRLLNQRMHAVLRRVGYEKAKYNQALGDNGEEVMVRGHLSLNASRFVCSWKGHEIVFTAREIALITALIKRPGIVKTRDNLLDVSAEEESDIEDRSIDSHIKRIRSKFRKCDPTFTSIETIYGVGYRYNLA